MTRFGRRRTSWFAAILVAASGCSTTGGGAADLRVCEPATGAELSADATLATHAGAFALVLVATRGPESGDTVRTELTLREHEGELRRVRSPSGEVMENAAAPLYGWLALEETPLGALGTGALDARDPAAPGVGVYETRSSGADTPPSILLRLGAAANRRDVTSFDGASTVLRVSRIEDDGFAGTWSSGTSTVRAAGHFCAVRAED